MRRMVSCALAAGLVVVASGAGCHDGANAPPAADVRWSAPDSAGDLPGPPDLAFDLALGDVSPTGQGPPYPIVLHHGFFGFVKIGPLDYFWKVKPALEAAGHVVALTKVDPFNSTIKVRGPQLLQQIEQVLVSTGAAKVNIFAHSQGGLDARWVAAQVPSRIAAVVSISSPHLGTRVADVLLKKSPGFSQTLAKAFVKAVARPFYGDISKDTDLVAALDSMTTASAAAFNVAYPDQPSVRYYAIAGRSNMRLAANACFSPKEPAFLKKYDSAKDPIDLLLLPNNLLLEESLLSPVPNDGMVPVASTKWGTWLGCIPADHFDEIGHLLGDNPGPGNPFDHISFYKDLAKFLVDQGF
jgi:triacylglycerol lipase